MHCISSDYTAFCYCEEVATPTLYFMGVANFVCVYFWHSKTFFLFHTNVHSTRKTNQVKFVSWAWIQSSMHLSSYCVFVGGNFRTQRGEGSLYESFNVVLIVARSSFQAKNINLAPCENYPLYGISLPSNELLALELWQERWGITRGSSILLLLATSSAKKWLYIVLSATY